MKNIISKLVNAIYYYDKPNVYRPTFNELDSRLFNCPKCKNKLSIPRHNVVVEISYVCPACGFKICQEKILNTRSDVEEYMAEQKKKVVDEVVKESEFIKESEE